MSSDGYPQAIEALDVCHKILTTAHRNGTTLPQLTVAWWDGEPSIEVDWFPTLADHKEAVEPLAESVTKGFLREGDSLVAVGDVSLGYSTNLHGIDVRFSIHR